MAAVAALAVLLFLGLAGYFASIQNLWIDESTQLSGSALPLLRMIAWLGGHPEPLGVPPDRMPPISYLADAVCGRTVCGTVLAYRWLHALITAAGIGGLVMLIGRRYGWMGAIVSGAFLAMAPQMLVTGVEIRAYPLFFAVTVLQLWLLFGLIEQARFSVPRLIAFALAGVLAIYTHFFGMISTSALFAGLALARARSVREWVWIAAAGAVVLSSAVGILPFVKGASAISTAIENVGPPRPFDIVLFLLRVIGNSSMMLHPWLVAIFCLALGLLLLLAIVRLTVPVIAQPRQIADPAMAVLIALSVGMAVTLLSAFVVHGFNPLKPTYSIWAVPMVALLAGAGCVGRLRPVALAAGGVMIAALAVMTYVFESHADWFVHGPERTIAAEIGDHPSRTAIVYTDDDWAYAYFPLIYRYRGALGQFNIDKAGALHAIGAGGNPNTPAVPMASLNRYNRLLLVSIQLRSYRELRAQENGAGAPADNEPLNGDLIGSAAAAWNSVNVVISPGVYWLRMTRLQRTDTP